MSVEKSAVITFPLPTIVGGGNASLGVRPSNRAGHVSFALSAGMMGGTVTIPAHEAVAFASAVLEAAQQDAADVLAGRKP